MARGGSALSPAHSVCAPKLEKQVTWRAAYEEGRVVLLHHGAAHDVVTLLQGHASPVLKMWMAGVYPRSQTLVGFHC